MQVRSNITAKLKRSYKLKTGQTVQVYQIPGKSFRVAMGKGRQQASIAELTKRLPKGRFKLYDGHVFARSEGENDDSYYFKWLLPASRPNDLQTKKEAGNGQE